MKWSCCHTKCVSFQKHFQRYLFFVLISRSSGYNTGPLLAWMLLLRIFSRCFFEHSCIVEKSNQQCSTQREWLQRLTHCNGLALLSWHLCLNILSQRCYCPCFLSKTLMHIQKIRMMLLEREEKTSADCSIWKKTNFFSHFILSGDGL